jgi:membrane fusion protein (multidrug efflux system)
MTHTETDRYQQNGAGDRKVEPRMSLHPPVRSVAVWGPVAAITLLAVLILIGAWQRLAQRRDQEAFVARTTQPEVSIATAQRDSGPKELTLPGNIQAFEETTIFPRSNGYVKSWKVDIGDSVKEGQVLAEIETPEVDQQVAQIRANYELAKATADRWKDLLAKNVVSKQEYDQNEKGYEAQKAGLQQLEQIQHFQQILAPFAGKISARNIDVGSLVTAGSGNTGTPLFSIVQSDPLRVYVYVPQANAASMHKGLKAKIILEERPGEEFEGTVTNVAGALDAQSRTLQVELQVPNHDGKLYAGMYAQVTFLLPETNAPIVVPADAFLFRRGGAQVVTVTDGNRIHVQKIRVGRDFGTQLEVLDGLAENTRVVINPNDDLVEGLQVQVKTLQDPNLNPVAAMPAPSGTPAVAAK